MTMMIWANPYSESENLGTDLYNERFELIKTVNIIITLDIFFHLEMILGMD